MKDSDRIKRIDLSREQIDAALAQAKTGLTPEAYGVLANVVEAYLNLVSAVERKSATIRHLQRILFGPTSEKTENLWSQDKAQAAGQDPPRQNQDQPPPSEGRPSEKEQAPRPGHGRNGASTYKDAQTVCVPHETLKPGEHCPACGQGKVYAQAEPGILVRVIGQAPLRATVYRLEKLRCNLCGEIFEASPPPEVGHEKKYDATAMSMIALLKYGSGLPFHRLGRLQGSLGLPLPPSTQWEVVRDAARRIEAVYEDLIRRAAQGEVLHNDDTPMKILAWMGKRRQKTLALEKEPLDPKRTGIFTSGIVSVVREEEREPACGSRRPDVVTIALYFTGRKHAGENLTKVLQEREGQRSPPIHMCDALSRNVPENFRGILANCLLHARRNFVDVLERFPEECRHLLETLKAVYRNDAITKKQGMEAQERLRFHQANSGQLMEDLRTWMQALIAEKKVEPNSGLGDAIAYMDDHWEKLTRFLHHPGAPLDNNVAERALKKAILHRKNALFYKTDKGARVGDLFMSLIHTCELNGVDAFHYLTEILRHGGEARKHPDAWMPWNYRAALAAAGRA